MPRPDRLWPRRGSGKEQLDPGNMHDERIVSFVDGELFHVVTNGRRSMPSYRFQITEKDRWAIVAYVRVLQRAWLGKLADVPSEVQTRLR